MGNSRLRQRTALKHTGGGVVPQKQQLRGYNNLAVQRRRAVEAPFDSAAAAAAAEVPALDGKTKEKLFLVSECLAYRSFPSLALRSP
jgi:hypothetical protein